MALVRRVLSPLVFALVALLFALPFAAARDSEGEWWRIALTWHGVDLTVGGRARVHAELALWDDDLKRNVLRDVSADMAKIRPENAVFLPGQPAFIVAALGVSAGVLAGLLAGARSRMLVSVVSAFAAVGALVAGLLLLLRNLDRQFGDAGLSSVPAYGFWLAAGILVLLGVGNAVAYRLRARGKGPGCERSEQPTD